MPVSTSRRGGEGGWRWKLTEAHRRDVHEALVVWRSKAHWRKDEPYMHKGAAQRETVC